MKDDVPPNAPCGRVFARSIYKVMTNSDLTEGRGRATVAAVYDNSLHASFHARGSYVMGTDAPVIEETATVVKLDDGTCFLVGSQILTEFRDLNEIRKKALAKLTAEERELLGVK